MAFFRLGKLIVVSVIFFTLAACGGGGGGSDNGTATASQDSSSASGQDGGSGNDSSDAGGDTDSGGAEQTNDPEPAPRTYYEPGEYASVSSCIPFEGSDVAELKVVFANLGDAAFADDLIANAVDDFRNLAPWSEFFHDMAFYSIDLNDAAGFECSTSGGFGCDDEKIAQAIDAQCGVESMDALLKVVFADTPDGGKGSIGDVIYLTTDPAWTDASQAQADTGKLVIHQVAHEFGLADYVHEDSRADGTAVHGWHPEESRQYLNLDGPGCSKWCGDFKPASEYALSESAQCRTFTARDECTSFNRGPEGQCEDADMDGHPDCCGWTEGGSDDYFEGSCTPVSGSEDIGLSCMTETGCYYGGAFGNNSWRPVRDKEDSIMYSYYAAKFDTTSQDALREVIRCCATSEDSSESCQDFRSDFADFLADTMRYNNRLGSCGVSSPLE